MPQNKLDQVGGVIAKKGGRSGRQMKGITYQTKGLKRRPSVWVELSGSHVERLKDVHREIIKGERNMQVRKQTRV